jgi:hypothetical protein
MKNFYVKHWVGDGWNRQYTNPMTNKPFSYDDEAVYWAVNTNCEDWEIYQVGDEEFQDLAADYK